MTISNEAMAEIDALKARDAKSLFSDNARLSALLDCFEEEYAHPYELPDFMVERDDVAVSPFPLPSGSPCYAIDPVSGDIADDRAIVYFHGGGWVFQPDPNNWLFGQRLADELGCRVYFAIYPLIPVATYKDAFEYALELYREALKHIDADRVFFMGDSAGGYMALATAQLALGIGLPQPAAILPLSPVFDLSDRNDQEKQERDANDIMIAWDSIDNLARIWAPDAERYDAFPPSPLYGPFEGLAPIHILSGGNEVLRVDSEHLVARAAEMGITVDLSVYEGMWHCWFASQGVPEAERAIQEIVSYVEARLG